MDRSKRSCRNSLSYAYDASIADVSRKGVPNSSDSIRDIRTILSVAFAYVSQRDQR
jgi:hypothetical protein